MYVLLRKIHTYMGLLSFTILTVFGIVGVATNLLPPPNRRAQTPPEVRFVEFQPSSPNRSDRELADEIQRFLDLPLTQPPREWQVGRNEDHNLSVRLFTPGGFRDAVFLEDEGRIRLEIGRFDAWQYLFNMHEITPEWAPPDWRLRAWAWYVEASMFVLALMALSGVWMWWSVRRRSRLAAVSFALGTGLFVFLYAAARMG